MNKLPDRFKIVVPQGFSRIIQEKLFSFGFKWETGDKIVMNEDKPFIYVEYNRIFYGFTLEWFLKDQESITEITISELMSIEPDSSSNLEELKTLLSELTDDLKNLSKKIEEKL